MNPLWTRLLPELRSVPPEARPAMLRRARDTALDAFELVGMAAGVVAVTALTRYVLPEAGLSTRFGAVLLNFAVAVPLLALLLGPFHLRRLRRGLRSQRREGGTSP